MPQDHALLGELGESPADRRSADRVALAELVLGREPLAGAVGAGQDLLQQKRLQLEVERDRLARVDQRCLQGLAGTYVASPSLTNDPECWRLDLTAPGWYSSFVARL
jgi:hypothetical protein